MNNLDAVCNNKFLSLSDSLTPLLTDIKSTYALSILTYYQVGHSKMILSLPAT